MECLLAVKKALTDWNNLNQNIRTCFTTPSNFHKENVYLKLFWKILKQVLWAKTNTIIIKTPFHWKAIPLRFEILVKMTRIVAETTRAQ